MLLAVALAGCRPESAVSGPQSTRGDEGHQVRASEPALEVATNEGAPPEPPNGREGAEAATEVAPVQTPSAYQKHCGDLQAVECLDVAEALYDEEDAGSQSEAIEVAQGLCFESADAGGCDRLALWLWLAGQREESVAASLEGCEIGDQRACATAGEYLVYGESQKNLGRPSDFLFPKRSTAREENKERPHPGSDARRWLRARGLRDRVRRRCC